MGYALSGGEGKFWYCNAWNWSPLLKLAHQHGWNPAGTLHGGIEELGGKAEDWHGSYVGNCGQWVTPEDAQELGKAIDRAVAAHGAQTGVDGVATESVCESCGKPRDESLLLWGGDVLMQFSEFCHSGGFNID